jgi:hypothetical protein
LISTLKEVAVAVAVFFSVVTKTVWKVTVQAGQITLAYVTLAGLVLTVPLTAAATTTVLVQVV